MSAHASHSPVLPTLALQPLPRHVRDLLQLVMKICTNSLEGNVMLSVRDLEQQLMRQIEQQRETAAQHAVRQALLAVEGSRSLLVATFLGALEAELALLQSPVVVRGQMTTRLHGANEMALVNDHEMEETSVLTDAATRAELANSLPLFLLGQRFGVLAGRPAFDSEKLPVGPQGLCRSIRRAVERVDLDVSVRLLLYKAFERQVMRDYSSLVEQLNGDLARNGVLPHLQYVPVRARRTAQNAGAPRATAAAGPDPKPASTPAQGEGTASTATSGSRPPRQDERGGDAREAAAKLLAAIAVTGGGAIASDEGYNVLRQLLSGRRQLLGKLNSLRSREGREAAPHVVSASDLQEALRGMQMRPAAPMLSQGRATARNIGHLKQDMLALLRRASPNQEAPALAEEHNDAIDLVAMLYDNLGRDLKPGGTVSNLLTKLQVPMLRVALQDQTFFTRQDHPARQMLNAIAETGQNWLTDDESPPWSGSSTPSSTARSASTAAIPASSTPCSTNCSGTCRPCRARPKSPSAATSRPHRARKSSLWRASTRQPAWNRW